MEIAGAVTTAPRSMSYLNRTLENILNAGFDQPLICHDPTLELGSYRNFKRALVQLMENSPHADAYLIFQDDLLVAKGLRNWLETNLWPEPPERIGVVSLYCAMPHCFNRSGWHKLCLQPEDGADEDHAGVIDAVRKNLAERGQRFPEEHFRHIVDLKMVRRFSNSWLVCGKSSGQVHAGRTLPEKPEWFIVYRDEHGQPYPSQMQPWGMAYGALALLLPRRNARLILEKCLHPESRTKTDIHVAETCCRLKLSFWMHTPSFIEHIGEISTLHERGINDFRRAGEFYTESV